MLCYAPDMRTIISHISALEFWRSALSDAGLAREQCRVTSLPLAAIPARSVRDHPLVRCGTLSLPVHVLALESRRSSAALTIHKVRPLPAGSLRTVSLPGCTEPVFVTCPELTLVHVARMMSFVRLIHLGLEFCGTFAPDASRPYGLRTIEPLTSPEKIASFVSRIEDAHGAKAVRAALPHLLSGSASPRESTLAELLTLPYLHGGSRFEHPAMNAVIPIPARSRWTTNRSSLRCDLLWPDKRVAVEYDSTLCHTGSERIADDASRKNTLEALGFTVVTATWKQVENYQEYNRFAQILARHLGTRIRPICSDYPARQFALRRELLG